MKELIQACITSAAQTKDRLTEITGTLADCLRDADAPITVLEASRLLCRLDELHFETEQLADHVASEMDVHLPMKTIVAEG